MYDSLKCFHELEIAENVKRRTYRDSYLGNPYTIHIWFSFATLYFFRGGYISIRTISCRSLLLYRVSVVIVYDILSGDPKGVIFLAFLHLLLSLCKKLRCHFIAYINSIVNAKKQEI